MLTRDSIIALLETNDLAVARALLVLNERQTQDEQMTEHTSHRNGRLSTLSCSHGFRRPSSLAAMGI